MRREAAAGLSARKAGEYGKRVTQEAVRIGIDENGLGPRLGPLVVTAVVAVTSGDGNARAESRPKGALRKRLDDSKKLVAYRDNALGEAWARGIARRMGHPQLGSPEAVVRALSLDAAEVLAAPCPGEHGAQCWSAEGEEFLCDAKLLARVERDLAQLEAIGVNVTRAACVVTCTRRLNDGVARGLSRFDMDLHAMERLTLEAREQVGRDVVATCGKVGGFDRYSSAFGPLGGRLHAVAEEGRARSEYVMPGLGSIAFVRDADANHLLVCMASLVGKWVRDVLMGRIVRYHRADHPDLPDASGYHDPVTTRFIKATRLTRKRRGLPDDCFERKALYPASVAPISASRRAPGSSRPSSA
jgi:ribonuclease HII